MATIYLLYYWCKVQMVQFMQASCRSVSYLTETLLQHVKMAAINVLIRNEGTVPNLEPCPLKPERTWANWKQSWNKATDEFF